MLSSEPRKYSETACHALSTRAKSSSEDCLCPLSLPESSFPLTSSRKTRDYGSNHFRSAQECAIDIDCEVKPDGKNSMNFLCYFKMVAPRALVFPPLVKGNEDTGNEIGLCREPLEISESDLKITLEESTCECGLYGGLTLLLLILSCLHWKASSFRR